MKNSKKKISAILINVMVILLPLINACGPKGVSSEGAVAESGVENGDILEQLQKEGWIALEEGPLFSLDIRYATSNNFVGEPMYECGKCFLRENAGLALRRVAYSLSQYGYKLVLFDCYRPAPVQQRLWDKVPNPDYVTPPEKGSMHNRGLAVDLSIIDGQGNFLDMGTEYDYFGREAHTDYTAFPEQVLKNRKLLRELMTKYGFKGIRTEWWHFSYAEAGHDIADWEWECP